MKCSKINWGLWVIVVLLPTWVSAQEVSSQTHAVLDQQSQGAVNWTEGTIVARGFGVPPPNVAAAAAGAMAERAAIAVARRNLLETIQGIQVDAETVVKNLILQKEEINTRVQGLIRNARILNRQAHSDGSVELQVSMKLWGKVSLGSSLLEEKLFSKASLSVGSEGHYTGVEFDTRGLRVKPAMFPTVTDERGELIYGLQMVSQAVVTGLGLAQYALSGQEHVARRMDHIVYAAEKKRPESTRRVGPRPLRIKGLKKLGSFHANIMISNADAEKIRQDPSLLRSLGNAKVIIITDPLVAGIEGRLFKPTESLMLAASQYMALDYLCGRPLPKLTSNYSLPLFDHMPFHVSNSCCQAMMY